MKGKTARKSLPRICPSPAGRGARNECGNGSVGGGTIENMIGKVIGRQTRIRERKRMIKGFTKSGNCSSTLVLINFHILLDFVIIVESSMIKGLIDSKSVRPNS
jgi:hypothetical protein